ncbi:MAG: rod shape-determining protein MreC [Candidatus Omnitrophota bacterium]
MWRKIPKQVIYAIVIVAPFWLLFFNSPFWHGIKLETMGVVASSVSVANPPLKELQIFLSYRKTYADYQKIQAENFKLKAQVVRLNETVSENGRFQRLLGLKPMQPFTTIAARVIARDPANWNSSLMIDKGSRQGIKSGMPVITALGVAGKVVEAADNSSKVILINDPSFSVAVLNQRSRDAGLLSGSLSGNCRLSYIMQDTDIQEGDGIITSSISTAFPAGLLVGRVSKVYSAGGISDARAEVLPAVDVEKIEEVLVIK